jgi:septal ring factor EnvC (AmiA/AmiB activator)
MIDHADKRKGAAPAPAIPQSASDVIEALKSDLLMVYRAVVTLEKRVNETAVNTADVRPQLIALKIHTESFPQALREVRRSDAAVQKTIADFDARLRALEARVIETERSPEVTRTGNPHNGASA